MSVRDRVGIGWRPELAASLYLRLAELNAIEVIADNYFRASRRERAALRSLARDVPLFLHGVGMGLASVHAVQTARLDRMARLVATIEPEAWTEHLAFVRAGGIEIGHLAAPPRTTENVDGALANIERAIAVVGARPQLENIATLIEPPGSTFTEAEWTRAIVDASDVPLLLDLHNLYANARNFGRDAAGDLLAMPLELVRTVHISGGVWVQAPSGSKRLLDDHLHDPPAPLFDLLALLAERVPQPLTVILERDGAYPHIDALMAQLHAARAALARGRRARLERSTWRQAA
jgi:hypothetical protein